MATMTPSDGSVARDPTVAIVGAGRLGSVLARALAGAGWRVVAVCDRDRAAARALADRLGGVPVAPDAAAALAAAGVVFLTVPDDALAPLAAALAAGPSVAGKIVFHTSGALTAVVLAPLAAAGARAGTLHPLQTFADPARGAECLTGVRWTGDGDVEAMALGERLVRELGGRLLRVPAAGRVLYHAAAVVASNGLVALAGQAERLLAAAGVAPEEALGALLPLMRSTLENLGRGSAAQALTGPVVRGDVDTVRRHLAALAESGRPDAADFYRALGRACLELAAARGLDPGRVAELDRLLADAG
ncbi:MAG: DUF2520 domain-containing protein [Planctomycetes bacterium]|nr:DUF2520 domain-containing protein [Planctomycetota bacterium]